MEELLAAAKALAAMDGATSELRSTASRLVSLIPKASTNDSIRSECYRLGLWLAERTREMEGAELREAAFKTLCAATVEEVFGC